MRVELHVCGACWQDGVNRYRGDPDARRRDRREGFASEGITANRRHERRRAFQLREMISDIQRRPAKKPSVRQHVPQDLAEAKHSGARWRRRMM